MIMAKRRRQLANLGSISGKLQSLHDALDENNCPQALDDLVVVARAKTPQLRQAVSRFRNLCLRKG
jgi:hypothetical protein